MRFRRKSRGRCHQFRPFAFLFMLPALLAPASTARAATYYLAAGGSDFNVGSVAAPWATLQRAVDLLTPGLACHR